MICSPMYFGHGAEHPAAVSPPDRTSDAPHAGVSVLSGPSLPLVGQAFKTGYPSDVARWFYSTNKSTAARLNRSHADHKRKDIGAVLVKSGMLVHHRRQRHGNAPQAAQARLE